MVTKYLLWIVEDVLEQCIHHSRLEITTLTLVLSDKAATLALIDKSLDQRRTQGGGVQGVRTPPLRSEISQLFY